MSEVPEHGTMLRTRSVQQQQALPCVKAFRPLFVGKLGERVATNFGFSVELRGDALIAGKQDGTPEVKESGEITGTLPRSYARTLYQYLSSPQHK
jgi:hypothetical protein